MSISSNNNTTKVLKKTASEPALREENTRLKADILRLKNDKSQLKNEKSQLKQENEQLNEQLASIKRQQALLIEEVRLLREELEEEKRISELKDIEIAENDALYQLLQEEHLRLEVEGSY